MMRYLQIGAIILASSLVAAPALARYPAPYRAPAYGYGYPPMQNTAYISGDIGYGALSTPDENIQDPDGVFVTDASHSNSSLAGGAAIGFRRPINPFLSLGGELGYNYDGQAKYTESGTDDSSLTAKLTSQNFDFLGTGALQFRNGFNIFGKAGGAYINQKLKLTGQAEGQDLGDSDTSINGFKPMVAAGIGYQLRKVNIYAQYSHIFGSSPSNFNDLFNSDGTLADIVSVDAFKLGLAFNLRV